MSKAINRCVVLGIATVLLAGCAASPSTDGDGAVVAEEAAPGFLAVAAEDAAAGGVLELQLDYDTAEAAGLDPHAAETARSWMLLSLVYETLVTVDENAEPQPGLAESWEQPSDTEYVFTLRDDAVFSNGRAVTGQDVAGSLSRVVGSGSSWSSQLGQIASIEATGEHEVTIVLDAPHTPLLAALAASQTAILPIQELEAGEFDPVTDTLGSGLLVAESHVQDESWSFSVNGHNPAAGSLGFSAVEIDIIADDATRLAALRDGTADLAVVNSLDAADLLADASEVAVAYQRNSDFYYLALNARAAGSPLEDAAVRFALNAAIDREQLIEVVLVGQGEPTGVTPAGLPGSCDAAELPSVSLSDEEITAALEGVGPLSIMVYDDPVQAQMAQVIQQQLGGYGVEIQIDQVDYGTFSDAVYAQDPASFELALSWYAGYVDPSMVTQWWNVEQAVFPATWMHDDVEVNELIDAGRQTEAGPERDTALAELCAAVDQNSDSVPLVTRTTVLGYNTEQLSPTIQTLEGFGDFLRHIAEFRVAE